MAQELNDSKDKRVDYSLLDKPLEQTNQTTLQYKIEMYQRAIREWAGSLSADEFAVVIHIVDRTIGWGQPSATITAGSMMHGGGVYSGLNIGRTKYFEVLKSLEEKGLIRRRKTGTGSNRVSINPGWTPATMERSERPKDGRSDPFATRTTPSASRTTPSATRTLYTGSPNTDNPETDTVSASRLNANPKPEAVRKKIEKAASVNRVARQAKINRTKGRTDVSVGIEATWRAALSETFPGVSHAPWDGRIRKNVKDKARAWVFANQVTFDDLVDWAVRNWTQIVKRKFKWMKKQPAPTEPNIGFFIRFAGDFTDAYVGNEIENWLKRPERTELERLMGKGRTREQALTEIAEKRAVKKTKDHVKAEVQKAKQIRGEARIAREQAQALVDRINVPLRRREPPVPKLKVTEEVDPNKVVVPIIPENNPFDD